MNSLPNYVVIAHSHMTAQNFGWSESIVWLDPWYNWNRRQIAVYSRK